MTTPASSASAASALASTADRYGSRVRTGSPSRWGSRSSDPGSGAQAGQAVPMSVDGGPCHAELRHPHRVQGRFERRGITHLPVVIEVQTGPSVR